MLYIKNTTIIDPISDRQYLADIEITNQIITGINQPGKTLPDGATVLDGTGLYAAPGLMDTHVHFRDPGFTEKEDIFTGAQAAAAGGFTGVVLMANTFPRVDNKDTLLYILDKGAKTHIHINTCANVTKDMAGKELTNMEELASLGACGFTDDGIPLMDEELVREAMRQARKLDLPISFHEENPAFITNNGINQGKASDYYGLKGSQREAEISLVRRDLKLALETGAKVVIQHISCKETVELIRQAKEQGACVYAEATPHHFSLTEEAMIQKGTMAKMNPPLRTQEDRLAIIKGLADDTIDLIATDHAPHTKAEKERAITQAPSGIIGLETALSLGIKELVLTKQLSYSKLIFKMSTAPCRLYNRPGGVLQKGAVADIVLFNPKEEWTVGSFKSKACNSPFISEVLPGVIYYTICNGEIIYQK